MPARKQRSTIKRRRAKDWLTLLIVILAFGATFAAVSAPRWMTPRWLALIVSAVGWTVVVLFNVGQVLVFWNYYRRPLAKRPWILGGPPASRHSPDHDP
jgi:hypothetical protein